MSNFKELWVKLITLWSVTLATATTAFVLFVVFNSTFNIGLVLNKSDHRSKVLALAFVAGFDNTATVRRRRVSVHQTIVGRKKYGEYHRLIQVAI